MSAYTSSPAFDVARQCTRPADMQRVADQLIAMAANRRTAMALSSAGRLALELIITVGEAKRMRTHWAAFGRPISLRTMSSLEAHGLVRYSRRRRGPVLTAIPTARGVHVALAARMRSDSN